jgi:hypothetical protein
MVVINAQRPASVIGLSAYGAHAVLPGKHFSIYGSGHAEPLGTRFRLSCVIRSSFTVGVLDAQSFFIALVVLGVVRLFIETHFE